MQRAVRTFLAVEIGSEIRARASALMKELAKSEVEVKWVEPHNLHWSLKFLGDVDAREIPALCDAVGRATKGLSAFDIEAGGAGAFPNVERPRTLWLGLSRGESQMVALHGRIEGELAPLGYGREHRRFRPHLTLGRVRGRGPQHRFADSSDQQYPNMDVTPGYSGDLIEELSQIIQRNSNFTAGAMTVDEVLVFSSVLSRGTSIYEPLATASLAG